MSAKSRCPISGRVSPGVARGARRSHPVVSLGRSSHSSSAMRAEARASAAPCPPRSPLRLRGEVSDLEKGRERRTPRKPTPQSASDPGCPGDRSSNGLPASRCARFPFADLLCAAPASTCARRAPILTGGTLIALSFALPPRTPRGICRPLSGGARFSSGETGRRSQERAQFSREQSWRRSKARTRSER